MMAQPAGHNRSRAHSSLVRLVTEYLQARGAWTLKVLGGLGQRAGVPDILACLDGHLVAVECKTGRGVLTQVQKVERGRLLSAGAIFCEARRLEDVEDALMEAGLIGERLLWPRREG